MRIGWWVIYMSIRGHRSVVEELAEYADVPVLMV